MPEPEGPRVAAVVLAAGMSTRMGRLKMLLPFGDRPMLARVVESLLAAESVSPIVVVTGHAEQDIRAAAVEYKGIVFARNEAYAAGGMLSSVKAGVAALPPGCDAFLLVLGDQPMVRPDTLAALRRAWRPERAPIVAPEFERKRGHPVMISMELAAEILALGPDDTLKTLMRRHAARIRSVAVADESVVTDIDTPEEYELALERWSRTGG